MGVSEDGGARSLLSPLKKKGPKDSTIMGYDGYMGGSNVANMGYQQGQHVICLHRFIDTSSLWWAEDFDSKHPGSICFYIIDRYQLLKSKQEDLSP